VLPTAGDRSFACLTGRNVRPELLEEVERLRARERDDEWTVVQSELYRDAAWACVWQS
jgi:hypothetical protein